MTQSAAPNERRQSVPVRVGNVQVGGGAPIVVQSMTNTDTADLHLADVNGNRLAPLFRGRGLGHEMRLLEVGK